MNTLIRMLILAVAFSAVGCKGVNRLIDGSTADEGTPYYGPTGPAAVANAVPVYDQTTATAQQDEELIRRVIGTPGTANFVTYCNSAWLPGRMDGIHNLTNQPYQTGYSSILVDGWKALYRRGYADISKVANQGIIHSNTYPVPVYQGDKTLYGY